MSTADLHSEWARLLIGVLARAGIEQAVISPGSRSTPLVVAALRCAGLKINTCYDERSAGYFALGQARITNKPSLLICTSGTAGAHYLPAIVEAHYGRIPLLALTADRPPELRERGANQTIDQRQLFGSHVNAWVDIGMPDADPAALAGLARTAYRLVALSRAPVAGPVHVNAPFRKPLEPVSTGGEGALRSLVTGLLGAQAPELFTGAKEPESGAIERVAEILEKSASGIIVAGPAPIAQREGFAPALALADRLRFPLLVEAPSQWRFRGAGPLQGRIDGFDTLFQSDLCKQLARADVVVQLGSTPTSEGLRRYVEECPASRQINVCAHLWNDAENRAEVLVHSDVSAFVRGMLAALGPGTGRSGPLFAQLGAANERVWQGVGHVLDQHGSALSEGAVASVVVSSLPEDSVLVVGNSLAVRQVDVFAPAASADVDVVCQRGTSGIDGLISGAAGAASVGAKVTTLLTGDLSFLHDLNGLALTRTLTTPLVIVVINNNGGRIFEHLRVKDSVLTTAQLEQGWIMPHGLALVHAAHLFGLRYRKPDSVGALRHAVKEAQDHAGATVVEIRVPEHGALADLTALRNTGGW